MSEGGPADCIGSGIPGADCSDLCCPGVPFADDDVDFEAFDTHDICFSTFAADNPVEGKTGSATVG